MIPPFSLPSSPTLKIRMREATVADAIDFADVDEGHEEEVTTLFLSRVQDGESFVHPEIWTGEDRRLALFWYWLHTEKDTAAPLKYDCQHCGEEHTFVCEFRDLAKRYTQIKGKAERELKINGEKAFIRPLSGRDLEYLEKLRLELEVVGVEKGVNSGEFKKKAAELRFKKFLCHIHFNRPDDDAKKFKEKSDKFLAMQGTEFTKIAQSVADHLEDMAHGLESEIADDGQIYLLSPPHKCPNAEGKEAKTQLRVPFRNIDHIPGI